MSDPRLVGYEVLRRVERSEVPADFPLNARTDRAVLGAPDGRYLIPPGIDVLELGLIAIAGPHELLPIDAHDKPLWDELVHLLVTKAQAARQRAILLRSFYALQAIIAEADMLRSSIEDWTRRGATHPVFGLIRLETIETWKAMRTGTEPLTEPELDRLHASVARRVAGRIRARVIR